MSRRRGAYGWPALVLALMASLGTGCGPGDGGTTSLPTYPPPPPPGPDPLTSATMYSLDRLPEFHLELDDAARAALDAQPKEYTHGTFRYGDTVIADVGVRLKGNFTLTTLDEKPSFKIKFNKFHKGRRFLGLEGLTLNNMMQDPTMLHERLGYMVFRTAGVPAPRTGYAQVVVNGEPYGVYLNIEPYNDDYLARAFDDATGNLYESESGLDVLSDPAAFDLDEGDDLTHAAMHRLAAAAGVEGDGVLYGDDALVDRAEFLGYMAAEAFVGHFEGYRLPHNYFMYHEPTADRWSFLPWNLDQTFVRMEPPFEGGGRLFRKCIDESDRCRLEYIHQVKALADAVQALDLSREIDNALALIGAASQADTRKAYSNENMEASRAGLRAWVVERVGGFRASVDCLVDGVEPDRDQDGYGACYHDCNEDDPAIHMGAAEVCDGRDNDCSGYADDIPACPCPSAEVEGATFFFCPFVRQWLEAETFCTAQGHRLAHFDTASQAKSAWLLARTYRGGRWAIGLNDRGTENHYVWPDGTEPSYTAWADGEPAHALEWFDCIFQGGGEDPYWEEKSCIELGAFMCRARDVTPFGF